MTRNYLLPFRPFRRLLAAALLAAPVLLPATGRAQMLSGSLTEGPASAPYNYYLTIQFSDGDYYDFTLRSTTASYSGYDFINAVSAGSQGTSLVLSVAQVGPSKYGYYISGMSVGSDMNTGFGNNYWAYWNSDTINAAAWTFSNNGESFRTITPGQADGWVFGTGTNAPAATTFAVPEPSALAFAALGLVAGGAWVARRRCPTR